MYVTHSYLLFISAQVGVVGAAVMYAEHYDIHLHLFESTLHCVCYIKYIFTYSSDNYNCIYIFCVILNLFYFNHNATNARTCAWLYLLHEKRSLLLCHRKRYPRNFFLNICFLDWKKKTVCIHLKV